MSVDEAALGIHRVVNAQMADGIRLVSVKRGYRPARVRARAARRRRRHPRDRARRGARASTACWCRAIPGVLSAAGLLAAPIEHEVSGAYHAPVADASVAAIRERLRRARRAARRALMRAERVAGSDGQRRYAGRRRLCRAESSTSRCRSISTADDPLDALYRDFRGGARADQRPRDGRAGEDRQPARDPPRRSCRGARFRRPRRRGARPLLEGAARGPFRRARPRRSGREIHDRARHRRRRDDSRVPRSSSRTTRRPCCRRAGRPGRRAGAALLLETGRAALMTAATASTRSRSR